MEKIKEKEKNAIFIEHFDDVKPIADFIPGQAYCLSDLMKRFERGQRLNVRENFNPASELCPEGQEDMYDEKFENAPPENVTDIVDIQRLYNEHQQTKQEFKKSVAESKKAKEGAKEDAAKKDDDKPTE